MAVLHVAQVMALAVWVGSVVFFSFVTAPSLFAVLPRDMAGRATAAIFPRYYALATAAAVVAVAGALVLGRRAAHPGLWRAALAALVLGLAATVWAGRVVQPRAAALRHAMHAAPADDPVRAEFARLHRLAVMLNGGALVAGLAGLGLSAVALQQ